VKVSLKIHNRTITIGPDLACHRAERQGCPRRPEFRDARGQSELLVIGPVEDADPPAFRKVAGGAPEKIVLQFAGAGMLEAEDLAALRIDTRHHVPDGAVVSCRVHRTAWRSDA
jgi:hypothetical protein